MRSLLFLSIIFFPIALYAHGGAAISIVMNLISITFVMAILKILSLKYLEMLPIKESSFKLFLLFLTEVIIFILIYNGCTNAMTWDIIKFVLYLFFPLALVANYLFFMSILEHKTKAIRYATIFVTLTVIALWASTTFSFECSDYYGLQKCNFFDPPDLKIFEFYELKFY